MTKDEQLDILYKLKKEIEKSDHQSFIHTINQIIKKVYLEQYTATFVGHFSAGKSTLINNIIEQEILPSSPVPTTSNTAIVTASEEANIIANIEGQRYTKLSNYDEVKSLNRENVDIESIEINYETDKFSNGFTLQDTPGVDSNVQTHRSSAESFLYTSNIIFYTVDYNHVQSAMNFRFMKELNQAGIPLVFVINQIDKHNEDEISFDTFKSRVMKSVEEWDIKLEDVFYVSKFETPHNQLQDLSEYLVQKDHDREPMDVYVNRMVDFITEHQLSYINNHMESILEALEVSATEFDEAYIRHQQHQSVSEESRLLNDSEALYNYLYDKRRNIIDNSYVMTHDMRETIKHYLESMTKDFKVGGFFNKKKKTEEERQKRLDAAVEHLQQKVDNEITKVMREDMSFLTRFTTSKDINERILNQSYTIEPATLEDLYQPQISISNNYVLTYCDDLMKKLKQQILKQSEPLVNDIIQNVEVEEVDDQQQDENDDYQIYMNLRNLKQSLETQNYKHYYIHMDDSLDKLIDRTEIQYEPKETEKQTEARETKSKETETDGKRYRETVESGLQVVKDIPLFESNKNDIQNTLDRLDNQLIKIGVFGTFSAGKSSLINALLGDHYLVSSPNPTTAATTEISYGNNSAITLKTQDELLEEINNVTEIVGEVYDSVESFTSKNHKKLYQAIEKNQLAFLKAIEQHHDMYLSMLEKGAYQEIPQDEIKKWSAEDEYATFVKTVHIQLEHPWLQDKIIVDSLGLHSNNQRHTNETEKILTSSDLILYVSYFNHSFTDNDKAFIKHMKDMNQLIENQAFKMVVNAVDLAETKQDEEDVIQYVDDALQQVDMHPEIFGVSSRNALQSGDDGINQLHDSITHFAKVESKHVLEHAMCQQLTQMNVSFKSMIDEHQNNKSELEKNKQDLKQIKSPKVFKDKFLDTTNIKSENEIEDQIYHLSERLKIQLLDEVKSVFNGQMTNTSNFNQEKRLASKVYLDQIQQRLYLEQTLMIERLKRFIISTYENEIAPTIKELQQRHVLIHPTFKVDVDEINESYLNIDLDQFVEGLPKQLTKKNILNHEKQKQIQETILNLSVTLLGDGFSKLRNSLMTLKNQQLKALDNQVEAFETEANSQIDGILNFSMDEALLGQLQEAIAELDRLDLKA